MRSDWSVSIRRACSVIMFDPKTYRYKSRRMRDSQWKGCNGYDRWFDEPINNAKLAPIAVYSDLVPDFKRLLELCCGDYPRFYRAVGKIGNLGPTERRKALVNANTCS